MTESTDDLAYRLRCETKRTDLPEEVVRNYADAYAAIRELQAERDEARREVCGLLVACHTDPDDEKPDPNLKNVHAGIRGWDCFKENTNG